MRMGIFILFLFVYSLNPVECNYMATTRQDGPVSSYIGAEKTAKLLSFIQKIRNSQKNYPYRSGPERKDEKNDTKDPNYMASMKLLQKNYDTSRQYYKDQSARRVNVQVISNPEVLDIYKQQSARRTGLENSTDIHHIDGVRVQIISNPEVLDAYRNMNARKNYEQEIDLDRQLAYGKEVKQNSRLSMHIFKEPEGALDFRRHRKVKKKSKSTSDSTSKSDNEDISSASSDSSDDEFRRSVVHFRVDEDLDGIEDNNSEDVTDVTLKPEEAFDIVKPFIVEIFNKLKEKNNQGKEHDSKNDDDEDFYDPKKVPSSTSTSDEDAKRIIKVNLRQLTTKKPIRFWSKQKEARDSDRDIQKNYNDLKLTKETPSLLTFPTTSDIPDRYDSWRKKEKEKKSNVGENISAEKFSSREIRFKKLVDDSDWKTKKLPASKKSFVEPTLTHEDAWDDKGYGYWKKTNWEKEIETNSGEKDKSSKDIKREDSKKKNTKNDDKDDDWDKKDDKKDSWGKPKKKIDDWDNPKKKSDDWDSPKKKKKDDWDDSKKNIDDWDKPKKDIDEWDKPKKKTDDWDSPKKKTDDWDSPKKKTDDWDSPKKKTDDWDSPKKKTDDWDSPKKKKDDWHSPKKKIDDDWDKPKKNNDDWDQPNSKKNDWDKADNWNKKKDTKSEQKLPDNKNRDRGWDMVGINDKKSGEKSYHKDTYGSNKKKSMYSEWGNYESFRNTKDASKEKETYKEMKVEDYKDDVKPKKKVQVWDSLVPKISHNYDRPRKSKTYDSYERRPGNSGFAGRTSIPQVGKKSIYAD